MYAYVLDQDLQRHLNRSKWQNHWDVYIQEINEQLGLRGARLSLADLEDAAKLESLRVLIIGRQSGARLSEAARGNLAEWVRNGGMLIGFAVTGLDEVFGVNQRGTVPQGSTRLLSDTEIAASKPVANEYAIGGYFDLQPHPLTEDVHSPIAPEQKLIIVSDLQVVDADGATELAHLYDNEGADLGCPAITWHVYGQGYAAYFAFDVAQTVWLLHQGKPIRGPIEGDPYSRSWQLQVIGKNSKKVAYADEIVFLLQNMIGQTHQPFIYQMPPDGGRIPDALFYWGGDCGPAGPEIVVASDWMKSKGLPYHINVRPHMEPEGLLDRIMHVRRNGHEVSIYYEVDPNRGLVEELLKWQSDYAYEHYGYRPGSSVCGPCTWTGWAEPAKWLVRAGNKADNSFIATDVPLSHPKMNDSYYGSGFGTFFPFFFYDDYRYYNERIDLIEQQITWYELGHHGSIGDRETRCASDVHEAVDQALYYHHATNVFYHPWYIANFPLCREAIEEILRYIGEKKALVMHMGDDQAADWWRARSRSMVENVQAGESSLYFHNKCQWLSGMIVKLCLGDRHPASITCDGQAVPYEVKHEFGRDWLYVVVPAGTHVVSVQWQ
ncbi:MAG: hypothetical protein ACUVWR_19365 [Anaerolineae bacterium]